MEIYIALVLLVSLVISIFILYYPMLNIRSPVVNEDGSVTLYYHNFMAKEVMVAGFFNDGTLVNLTKNKSGIWEYTTPILEEGTYTYKFKVDGSWLADPLNPKKNKMPQEVQSILDVGAGDYYVPVKISDQAAFSTVDKDNLVVVTLNTHSFQEKVNRFKKLIWIAKGLSNLNADIIGLNEIVYGNIYSRGYCGKYYDTAQIIKENLESLTGTKYYLYKVGFARWEQGENLANAIISRYPLYNSQFIELTTISFWPAPISSRNCLCAQIIIEDKGALNVFVTHTMGYDCPETLEQITEIKNFTLSLQTQDLLGTLILGDFNVPQNHPHYLQLIKSGPVFNDIYALANPSRINESTILRDKNERIDYILWMDGRYALQADHIQSAIIFKNESYKGDFYPLVSDHFAVVAILRIESE